MTEEIIIDGVNVARCCCYKNGKCLWTKRYYESDVVPDCEKIKDCYYKQLKRLEQENKELRQQYNCYACDTCQGKEDYRNMKRHCENAIKTVHAYRSALETIQRMILSAWEQGKYLDGGLYNDLTNEFAKINEVLQ